MKNILEKKGKGQVGLSGEGKDSTWRGNKERRKQSGGLNKKEKDVRKGTYQELPVMSRQRRELGGGVIILVSKEVLVMGGWGEKKRGKGLTGLIK